MIRPEKLKEVGRKYGVDAKQASARTSVPRGIGESSNRLKTYLESRNLRVKKAKDGDGGAKILVLDGCPMNADHGRNGDTAVVWRPTGIGFECKHNGCQNFTWRDVRRKIDPDHEERNAPAKNATPEPREIKPHRPFPVETLPDPVRHFVLETANAIGCPVEYVALVVIAVLGACIGGTRRVQLKRSWREYPVVWAAIIGGSGTLKSPAFAAALAPLQQHQDRLFKEYEDKLKDYEKALARYDAEYLDWKKKKRDQRGEPPIAPEPPVCKRVIVSDTTPEALAVQLKHNPRGILHAHDELARLLGGFDRYTGARCESAQYLQMHRAGPLYIDRKTGTMRTIYIPRAAVSIVGCIQPEILTKLLTRERFQEGFAARLLFAFPPRHRKKWTEADVDKATFLCYAEVIDRLLVLDYATNQKGEIHPVDVILSLAAQQLWVDFYNEHAGIQDEADGDLAAAFSKLEGYAARLALIVHLTKEATRANETLANAGENGDFVGANNVGAGVDAESMQAGIELARWFVYETERIYTALDETGGETESRELYEYIRAQGGRITPRKLAQNRRRFERSTEQAKEALEALVERGLAEWHHIDQKGPGRPSRECVLIEPTGANEKSANEIAPRATENGDFVGSDCFGAVRDSIPPPPPPPVIPSDQPPLDGPPEKFLI